MKYSHGLVAFSTLLLLDMVHSWDSEYLPQVLCVLVLGYRHVPSHLPLSSFYVVVTSPDSKWISVPGLLSVLPLGLIVSFP